MTFEVEDFQDLIRLLGEHPEWRQELRRHVLSEELLELPQLVRQLADAQVRTEQRLAQLAARVEELAAAQVRTEQRLEQLTARVDDLTVRLEQLTARVDDLTVRMEQLTARVDDLTVRMERVEEQIAHLAARMEQLTARVDDLTVRLEQLTARVDELATAQVRTEQRLEQLIARVDVMERDLSNLRSEFRGYRLEWRYIQRPSAFFGPILRRLRLVWPSEAVDQFEDRLPRWAADELLRADLLVTGVPRYQPETGEVWLVVEVSGRVDRGDVERAVRRAEALRAAGLRAVPAVAGERTTQGALAAVHQQQVVLFKNGAVDGWDAALERWAT